MSISSSPAAACHRTARAGSPVSRASFCRYACCRGCSDGCSSKNSTALHKAGWLAFFGDLAPHANDEAFAASLAPLRSCEWVIYAKRPFAGPKAVLAYLSRYTHRVAISNSRLVAMDDAGVTFKWKDYRIEGPERYKTMTLEPAEFIRRFLMHVLPSGLTASAITACSPARRAPATSSASARCLRSQSPRRNNSRKPRWSAPLTKRGNAPVAAAG